MAVPRCRKSKSRMRMRIRSHQIKVPVTNPCPNCREPHLPHRVCPACGYYKGRQILTITAE